MRSWWFLLAFCLWTAWWWAQGWPLHAWFAAHIHDQFPYTFWNVIISLFTFIDIVVYGIRQMRQDERGALVSARTAELMRAVHAQNAAMVAALEQLRRQDEAQARFEEQTAAELRALREAVEQMAEGRVADVS